MNRRRIVLAVTIDDSLQFLKGYPEYLAEHEWEVHVVSNAGPRLAQLALAKNVVTHPIQMRRDPSPINDLRSLWQWCRLLRSIHPAAVSVGTPKAGMLGILSAVIVGVPVRIYMLRGLRLETSTGLRRRLLVFIERFTMLWSTEVLSVSHSLRNRALELRLVSSRKIRVLGHGSSNGTDIFEFDATNFSAKELATLRAEIGLMKDLPVIGFVGRLTRDKGLFVLADALEKLADQGVDFQVLIVGDVDDPSGLSALNRLRELTVPITVTGHVLNPASHYALMDVLCLPSYREGFVNVVIEASASGIPVVVSNATGVVDTVSEGATGFVVPVADSDGFAARIAELISNPTLAADMGAKGRIWVSEHFNRMDVQKNYADHLESLVERRGPQ